MHLGGIGGTGRTPGHGRGQPHVKRQVPFARVQDGQTRLGARLHHGPDLQRGLQAVAATPRLPAQPVLGQTLVGQGPQALVKTVVVRHVAARAQQPPHGAAEGEGLAFGGAQGRCHQVEHGRSPRRQQHFGALKQTFGVALAGQCVHALHELRHQGAVGVGVAFRPQALVTFQAHQPHGGAGLHRAGQCQGLVRLAATGPPAVQAQFQQHVKTGVGVLGRKAFNGLQLLQ